jgi:type I restriction enzyme S subunit
MKHSAYPKYKPSGVEWLGDVPHHWNVKRTRFMVAMNPTKQEINHLPPETEVQFLPMESVSEDGSLNLETTRPIFEVISGYTYFAEGDVTFAKITPCFENGKGAIMRNLQNSFGFGTTELTVIRPGPSLNNEYLYYLTISRDFRKNGEAWMYGAGGQKRVPDDFVREFRLAFPPLYEQQAIAYFLDRETGRIDSLIGKKKKFVELLKEKRTALISRAVTKGLNLKVKMKSSSVEWLGDVPEHWQTKKLRYLCNIQTGDKDTIDAVDDGNFPFYVRSQTVERIDSFTFDCEAVLTAGDGVGVGKVFHYVNGKFDFHQRVYMFNNFKKIKGTFFFYYLRENFWKVAFDGGAKSTVDSLRRPMITNFTIVVPPLAEQQSIIDFLVLETGKMETLIAKVETVIEKLKEYRAALISAAVSGKIDVREVS